MLASNGVSSNRFFHPLLLLLVSEQKTQISHVCWAFTISELMQKSSHLPLNALNLFFKRKNNIWRERTNFGEVEEVLSNVLIPSVFPYAILQNELKNTKQNVCIEAYTQFSLRDTGHSAQTDNPLINSVLWLKFKSPKVTFCRLMMMLAVVSNSGLFLVQTEGWVWSSPLSWGSSHSDSRSKSQKCAWEQIINRTIIWGRMSTLCTCTTMITVLQQVHCGCYLFFK